MEGQQKQHDKTLTSFIKFRLVKSELEKREAIIQLVLALDFSFKAPDKQ